MRLDVIKLDGTKSGHIELSDDVFGVEPKKECLADIIRWQLAKRQAGTHAAKTRGFINRTKKKMYRQKGTGNARHGARTANIFVGGGVVFGPTPRSHAFKLNKKVRQLALKTLLTIKLKENNLMVCENLNIDTSKTKALSGLLSHMKLKSALCVDDSSDNTNFRKACSNIYKIDVLPAVGFNAYDGLRHEKIILTRGAVSSLQQRLLG
jgi:large subunit ribosomal protein L4